MKNETIKSIRNKWKEMSNSSKKPNTIETMYFLLLTKSEDAFKKAYTPLSNKKQKHTIYDYNYAVVNAAENIKYEIKLHVLKKRDVNNTLLMIAVEDEDFDMSKFFNKVETITASLVVTNYKRWFENRH